MSRKVLIDLLKLKNLYTGLGQVSWQFAQEVLAHQDQFISNGIKPEFLLPTNYKDNQIFRSIDRVYPQALGRWIPAVNSKPDIWHGLHQDSAYMPPKESKFVFTIHDLNFMYEKEGYKQQARLKKIRNRIARADAVTTISHFVKSEIQRYIPDLNKPVEVIYNGVADLTRIPLEKSKAIKTERSFLFTIGHLSAKKNIGVLLEMMKLLPHYDLIIAGQDQSTYAKELKAIIRQQRLNHVHVIGKVSDQEKAWLYKNCAAFLFPSLHEGFGLPIIEAMQFGKPIVAAKKTSLPEIGGPHAAYWEHFEPAYMSSILETQMNKILDTILMKQYADEFSWQANVKAYLGIYQNL